MFGLTLFRATGQQGWAGPSVVAFDNQIPTAGIAHRQPRGDAVRLAETSAKRECVNFSLPLTEA